MHNKSLLLLSLILSILGILTLLLLNQILPPIEILSDSELKYLQDNQKIRVEGLVTAEFQNKNSKTLIINEELKLFCQNCPSQSYLYKNISATAIIEKFSNKTYLKILKMEIKK